MQKQSLTLLVHSLLCSIFLLVIFSSSDASTTTTAHHKKNLAPETQIKILIKGSAAYKVSADSHHNQITILLTNPKVKPHLISAKFSPGLVSHVQHAFLDPHTLRLVVSLKKTLHLDSVVLKPNPGGETLLLTFHPIKSNTTPILSESESAPTSPKNSMEKAQDWVMASMQESDNNETEAAPEKTPEPISTKLKSSTDTETKTQTVEHNTNPSDSTKTFTETTPPVHHSQRPIIVVIDPGHGGKDPGTVGPHGTYEKDIALAISRTLQKTINEQTGFHAVLTRNRDTFIPLRQRLKIARQDKADMFVAIHADAYQDPYATGASVYALSPHGASSEAARWLAAKENYSELGSIDLKDKSDVLRSVLIDLSQTATIVASVQIGNNILQQIARFERLHHNYVEQAPFMVLKSPDIPSLLVETGFLSNPDEETRLRDADYQQRLANAICAGIKNYFWNNPPSDTRVASVKNKGKLL